MGHVGTCLGFVRAPKSRQHDSSLDESQKTQKTRLFRDSNPAIWEHINLCSEIATVAIWEGTIIPR